MSRSRWIVSVFIVWHLTSITINSLPTSRWASRGTLPETGTPFPSITRLADGLSRGIASAATVAQRVSGRALDRPVGWYISFAGLAQQWAMFSNPPHYDRYWRVRYYIEVPGSRRWMATELIGPSHREDQVRIFQSYRDSYRDKAFEIAFDGFIKRRKPSVVGPGTLPNELPDDLAPIGRYFARRFSERLPEGERIVRIETWVGTVDNKPMGRPVDATVAVERRAALLGYTDGPVEERLAVRPYPPYHGVEHEGDIKWLLEYYEQP